MNQGANSPAFGVVDTDADGPPTPSQLASACMLVTVVEPDAMRSDYFGVLGHYRMMVPPRKGEVLLLEPALSCGFARYVVRQVIHHMPQRGSDNMVENAVTLVVSRHVSRRDIEAALGFLTRRANGSTDRQPPAAS